MSELRSFEDLACYQAARDLRVRVSTLCKTLPPDEKYRLADQLLRASRSIGANIAEGYGRHHHRENAQFCRQARGSLSEVLEHLNCAKDEGYLSTDRYGVLREEVKRTWKILNGYIAYLCKCANDGVPSPIDDPEPHQPNNSST